MNRRMPTTNNNMAKANSNNSKSECDDEDGENNPGLPSDNQQVTEEDELNEWLDIPVERNFPGNWRNNKETGFPRKGGQSDQGSGHTGGSGNVHRSQVFTSSIHNRIGNDRTKENQMYGSSDERAAAIRPLNNLGTDACSHFIKHTVCYCSPNCVLGVCKKCFLVFCNSSCLKSGISDGKIEYSSKRILNNEFGREGKEIPARPTPVKTAESKSDTSSNSSGSVSKFSAQPARGRGRGSPSSYEKSNSFTESRDNRKVTPPSGNPEPYTGFFRKCHRYEEGFRELSCNDLIANPFADKYIEGPSVELGGTGHFDNPLQHNARSPMSLPLDANLGVSRCFGGRGISLRPSPADFMTGPQGVFGRGRGRSFDDKVLRDPLSSLRPPQPPPPLVSRGNEGRVLITNLHSPDNRHARLDTFTEIKLTTPLSGVNDYLVEGPKFSSLGVKKELDETVKMPLLDCGAGAINLEPDVPLAVNTVMRTTWVESSVIFYFTWGRAHVTSHVNKLTEYGSRAKLVSKLEEGNYCLIWHEGDDLNPPGYNRGLILPVEENKGGLYRVRLIDLGVIVSVPAKEILELAREFYYSKRLAFRFGIKDLMAVKKDDIAFQAKMWLEKNFGIDQNGVVFVSHVAQAINKSLDNEATKYWGTLSVPGVGDISNILIENGFAIPRNGMDPIPFQNSPLLTSVVTNDVAAKELFLIPGSRQAVRICKGAKSLLEFSVMKEESEGDLLQLLQLCDRLGTLGTLPYQPWISEDNTYPGLLCFVRHPEDRKFCRARVRYISKDLKVFVKLLDTGELLSYEINNVMDLPPRLRELAPLAYVCALPLKVTNPDTELNLQQRLSRFSEVHPLKDGLVARVLNNNDNGLHIVDLKFVSEGGASFCETLRTLQEVELKDDSDIQEKVRKDLDAIEGIKTDQRSALPIQWCKRAERDGFDIETAKNIEQLSKLTAHPVEDSVKADLPKFHYNQLPALPPISGLAGNTCLFNRFIGFNIFTVIGEDKQKELEKAITEWAVTADEAIFGPTMPNKDDIVMVPIGKTYRRGVVEEIDICRSTKASIRLLEYGTLVRLPICLLRKPNDCIMKVPRFVYFAQLEGVAAEIPVLIQQFRELRSRLNGVALMGPETTISVSKSGLPIVCLLEETSKRRLSSLINDLAVWAWRKYYRGMYITFDEIVKSKQLQFKSRIQFFKEHTITGAMKRANVELTIRTVAASPSKDYITFSGIPLDPIITYQNRSLYSQLGLYMSKITCTNMVSDAVRAYVHMVAVKPSEKRLKEDKYPSLCTWHRTFYNPTKERLVCMDCFWKGVPTSGEFPEMSIRPLTPDFYEVCPMGMTCKVDVSAILSEDVTMADIVKNIFSTGKTITVNITSKEPVVDKFSVYYTIELMKAD